MKKITTLWGSAFTTLPSEAVISFTAGKDVTSTTAYDYHLLPYDIWTNQAHVMMLAQQKIISETDKAMLLQALKEIKRLAEQNKFKLDPAKEDVHTNIETWIIEKCGLEVGGKLHTARSRNDQVATDTRLYLRDASLAFVENTLTLAHTLLTLAQAHQLTFCPGYTHHQPAMVTTFGHILLGYAAMLVRDSQRFLTWFDLHNQCPLGSTTAYGTTLPIDRELTSKLLAFDHPTSSSIDPIINRWEAESDLVFNVSVMMNHLSSLAETLIIFSMVELGFVTLADEFSTGSSMMPQKKNPDPLEVLKGKTSYVAGILQSLLSNGKVNFIGYNRDSQWTKYQVIDVVTECLTSPILMSQLMATLKVNKKQMAEKCNHHFIGATNVVESLVKTKQLSLRQAKILVEKAIKNSNDIHKITHIALTTVAEELGLKAALSEEELQQWQDPYFIVTHSSSAGGPGLTSQQESAELLSKEVIQISKKLHQYQQQISTQRNHL